MVNIKQTSMLYNRYLYGMIVLAFILLTLSQKPNFISTMIGISLTLITFFVIVKIREIRTVPENMLTSMTGKDQFQISEDHGAFAKFDKNFDITHISNDFKEILGIDEGNLVTIFNNCMIDETLLKKIKATTLSHHSFNEIIKLKIANQIIFLDTFIHTVNHNKLTKSEYIMICSDITSYITNETELKNQLLIDKPTQLPTRLRLIDDLKSAALKKSAHAQTLIYLQIDSYEEINEYFGIDSGAILLQEIAKWIKENLLTKNTKLYKFEHNNFVMHTTSRVNLSDLETYLKSVSTKLQNHSFLIQDTYHDISISIGVARGNANLLKHAYLALKDAQKHNKNYLIFNKKNHQEDKFLQNMQINKNIKKALLEDRIVPFFQPILNLQTDKVEKFESLMRIQNQDNTHQKPADFLEIAKKSKLYPDLTKAMINSSLKRLDVLNSPITINIAIEDILNTKIATFILRKLQKCEDASLITFEILESDEVQNYKKVANFIKKIKALGCSVAIDDFGSGYSNFEQLLKLNIDYIKIDGSLIKDIDTNKESEIVTKTIISFAKELGVKTVAEFVSSQSILDKVKLLGVDYAQGYHIGKPVPVAQAKKFI